VGRVQQLRRRQSIFSGSFQRDMRKGEKVLRGRIEKYALFDVRELCCGEITHARSGPFGYRLRASAMTELERAMVGLRVGLDGVRSGPTLASNAKVEEPGRASARGMALEVSLKPAALSNADPSRQATECGTRLLALGRGGIVPGGR